MLQVEKNQVFSEGTLQEHFQENGVSSNKLVKDLKDSGLHCFVSTGPKKFYPSLVVEFFKKVLLKDKYFTEVYSVKFTISPQILL